MLQWSLWYIYRNNSIVLCNKVQYVYRNTYVRMVGQSSIFRIVHRLLPCMGQKRYTARQIISTVQYKFKNMNWFPYSCNRSLCIVRYRYWYWTCFFEKKFFFRIFHISKLGQYKMEVWYRTKLIAKKKE